MNTDLIRIHNTDYNHRRRINTEETPKVVAAVWGDRIYLILCRTSYFALSPQIAAKTFAFFCIYPSSIVLTQLRLHLVNNFYMLLGFCFENNNKNWFLLGIMVRSGGLVSIPRKLSFGEHKNLKPGAHSSNDKHAIVLKEQLGDNLLICYTSIAKLA